MHMWHEFIFPQGALKGPSRGLQEILTTCMRIDEVDRNLRQELSMFIFGLKPIAIFLVLKSHWENLKVPLRRLQVSPKKYSLTPLQLHSDLPQPRMWPPLLIWEFCMRITCKPLAMCREYLNVLSRAPQGGCKGVARGSHSLFEIHQGEKTLHICPGLSHEALMGHSRGPQGGAVACIRIPTVIKISSRNWTGSYLIYDPCNLL